jgi:V/A-type H+-transporting ATPase subunit K
MSLGKSVVVTLSLLTLLIAVGATIVWLFPTAVLAQGQRGAADPEIVRWAFASAAVVAGLGTLAAAYAVAAVGAAAVGALAEKPELFGRLLVLVGLAEGIAIYGLIVAVLIFNRVS